MSSKLPNEVGIIALKSIQLETPEHRYSSFKHGQYACEYHVLWCTKYRRAVLSPAMRERLKELILEQQEAYDYKLRALETRPDHVHLLISVPPNVAVTSVIGKIKGYTSKVIREEFPAMQTRLPTLWTRSKFVASTGGVTLDVLKAYIENQKGQ